MDGFCANFTLMNKFCANFTLINEFRANFTLMNEFRANYTLMNKNIAITANGRMHHSMLLPLLSNKSFIASAMPLSIF